MVEDARLNVVDSRLLWRTLRFEAQASQLRMAILEVAVEQLLFGCSSRKNRNYFTATYGGMVLEAGKVVGLGGGFAGADEVCCGFLRIERLVEGHGLATDG